MNLFVSFRLLRGTPDLILGIVIWLVGFAAIVLIFSEDPHRVYYEEPARR